MVALFLLPFLLSCILLSCFTSPLHSFYSASLISCILPLLYLLFPSSPAFVKSCISPSLFIPHVLHPSCRVSLLSCIPSVLRPPWPASSCPASVFSSIHHLLNTSFPASSYPTSLLSCIPPLQHPSYPASPLSCFPHHFLHPSCPGHLCPGFLLSCIHPVPHFLRTKSRTCCENLEAKMLRKIKAVWKFCEKIGSERANNLGNKVYFTTFPFKAKIISAKTGLFLPRLHFWTLNGIRTERKINCLVNFLKLIIYFKSFTCKLGSKVGANT